MTLRQAVPVVLLPGWGFSPAVFAPLVATLGAAAMPKPLPIPERRTGDVDAVLRETVAQLLTSTPAKAHWVGWSLGGLVALAVAASAPERVTHLTLFAATPRFTRAPDWAHAVEAAALSRFGAGLDTDPTRTLKRFAALCAHGSGEPVKIGRELAAALQTNDATGAERLPTGLAMLAGLDLRDRLADVRPSVRWVLGREDPLVPIQVGKALRRLRPDMEILELNFAGHAPFLSHPDACAEFLLS